MYKLFYLYLIKLFDFFASKFNRENFENTDVGIELN